VSAQCLGCTFNLSLALFGGFTMRTLLTRLGLLLGIVTTTATVTVIGPATAIATAGTSYQHNEVMVSG
jgi:hypothetical protein